MKKKTFDKTPKKLKESPVESEEIIKSTGKRELINILHNNFDIKNSSIVKRNVEYIPSLLESKAIVSLVRVYNFNY